MREKKRYKREISALNSKAVVTTSTGEAQWACSVLGEIRNKQTTSDPGPAPIIF